MSLNNLKPAKGSIKHSKRIGRGAGSGKGGTATRGNKGAKARSGYHQKIGFEGGQMPIYRRLPKFGFKNINRVEYQVVNISSLQKLVEKTNLEKITIQDMVAAGLVSAKGLVKVLGNGTLTAKVDVEANAFSKSAEEAIQNAGGTATKL